MAIPLWKEKKIYEKIEDIKTLKVQGAHNVARTSIEILKEIALRKGFNSKEFKEMADFLQDLRPTQVITYNLIEYVKYKKTISAFNKVERFLENTYPNIAKYFLEVIEGNEIIITHCHSSEEIYAIKKAYELGYDFEVYVTETRPKMQGIKSAKELAETGIKVKYIVDDAAGFFMEEVDALVVGIDAITKQGIWNKIGTYMMALAAKHHAKDVIFVGDIAKIDLREKTYVEMRNPNEIIPAYQLNHSNIEILNPAFDLTPWHLIDVVVTGVGIIKDNNILNNINYLKLFEIIEKYPLKLDEVIGD